MNLSFDLIYINCFLDTAGNRNLIAEDALVRAAGMGKEDRDDEGADAGRWMLDAGCWLLDAGHPSSPGGLRRAGGFLVSGCWFLSAVLPSAKLVTS